MSRPGRLPRLEFEACPADEETTMTPRIEDRPDLAPTRIAVMRAAPARHGPGA
jgi:hypothetical protein